MPDKKRYVGQIEKDRIQRARGVVKTKTAPPAQGQESLQRYMSEEKYLIRKPKRDRGRRPKRPPWPVD